MSALLIPNGTKNLTPLFPSIDWNNISEYYVEVYDTANDLIATTAVNKLRDWNNDECIRVHFLNYQSTFDAINFMKPKVTHEDKSSEFKKSLSYPLNKSSGSIQRFNINSNDTYEAKYKCTEDDMLWLQECADSPILLLEWQGTEEQEDGYIPLIKIDGKFDKLKNVQEYDYEFVIQFKLSNEFMTIRN